MNWTLNQQNRITFVMVDAAGAEVAGLGNTFTLEVSKAGAAFAASAGVGAEIGNGWYTYLSTAAEADTVGPIAIRVNGAGCVQQNLEYVVAQRTPNAIAFTYTVIDSATLLPVEGVEVWFTTDAGGSNVVWTGVTDAFGVARDANGALPLLDPGVYAVWRQKPGFTTVNPDWETVS
ncbi:MAG: hypothetical protein IT323_13545 [Anaerolineae bacterium]|nr:hypothetical protein [Anaerolineae bacterium]